MKKMIICSALTLALACAGSSAFAFAFGSGSGSGHGGAQLSEYVATDFSVGDHGRLEHALIGAVLIHAAQEIGAAAEGDSEISAVTLTVVGASNPEAAVNLLDTLVKNDDQFVQATGLTTQSQGDNALKIMMKKPDNKRKKVVIYVACEKTSSPGKQRCNIGSNAPTSNLNPDGTGKS